MYQTSDLFHQDAEKYDGRSRGYSTNQFTHDLSLKCNTPPHTSQLALDWAAAAALASRITNSGWLLETWKVGTSGDATHKKTRHFD